MSDSMHHEHDLDLVSALAEGRLADPGPAEELVASCPECEEVYRSHLAVLRAVEEAPRPELTDREREHLRTALWEEVSGASEPVPLSRRTTPRWYRLLPVAAVLVVVIGMASFIDLGVDEAAREPLANAPTPTTEATGGDGAQELAPLSDSADDAGEQESSPEATESESSSQATEAADEEAADSSRPNYARVELAAALEEFRERAAAGQRSDSDPAFDCDPPPDAGPLLALEAATVEGTAVWFAAYGEPEQVDRVVAIRQSDCERLGGEE